MLQCELLPSRVARVRAAIRGVPRVLDAQCALHGVLRQTAVRAVGLDEGVAVVERVGRGLRDGISALPYGRRPELRDAEHRVAAAGAGGAVGHVEADRAPPLA